MAIKQFRVALTTDDFNQTAAFFRDGLGLEPGDLWTDAGNGQMFQAGQASLEIFDPEYAAWVDQIETGQQVSDQIRFAFEVDDLQQTLERALSHGAVLVHEQVLTPWNDLCVRIQSPNGLQITLFQPKAEDSNLSTSASDQ